MGTRNYIVELGDIRARLHRRGERFTKASRRLTPLLAVWTYLDDSRKIPATVRTELRRHLPVAMVAALEGYCRLVYADLINAGEPYRSNARKLQIHHKFTADTVLGIGKSCSAGELIAHLLPHNSIEDVATNLSTLLGTDFKVLILSDDSIAGDLRGSLANDKFVEVIWKDVGDLFKFRHIICHELATRRVFTRREVHRVTFGACALILFIESFIGQKLKRK